MLIQNPKKKTMYHTVLSMHCGKATDESFIRFCIFCFPNFSDVKLLVETSDIIGNTLWKIDLNPFVYRFAQNILSLRHVECIDTKYSRTHSVISMRCISFVLFESINDDSLTI